MDETTMYNFDRIIPAHAGNTYRKPMKEIHLQDHPRSCGEYVHRACVAYHQSGSSPLMRGILCSTSFARVVFRIIPAHAGNTIKLNFECSGIEDHPRSCGEYSS